MELLTAYSSDDSNGESGVTAAEDDKVALEDDNVSPEDDKVASEDGKVVDYFNLKEDDSPSNYFNLWNEADKLSEQSYGPKPLNDFHQGTHNTNIPRHNIYVSNSTKQTYQETSSYVPELKRFKQTEVEDSSVSNKVVYISEDHQQVSQKDADNNKPLNLQPKSASQSHIFHTENKISQHELENVSNVLPKHQSTKYHVHDSCVTALSWCIPKYSHLLLSASLDSTVKIWDLYKKKVVQEIKGDMGLKAARWSMCGTNVICGGFRKKALIFDINTGQELHSYSIENYVSSIEIHPDIGDIFLIGTKNCVKAFDKRSNTTKPVKEFSSNCQYVLDMVFLKNQEFLCSTEIVSHDSADRTLMVWDFATGAIMSNQIYHERYTCPSVCIEPSGKHFIAQSNGNYIAMFSSERPYKMKNKKYAEHKVEGYSIGCDFSPDGRFIISGDAEGGAYAYNSYHTTMIKKLNCCNVPTTKVKWHPVLSSTIAIASWNGTIQIWQ